jgi:hypothetical protein
MNRIKIYHIKQCFRSSFPPCEGLYEQQWSFYAHPPWYQFLGARRKREEGREGERERETDRQTDCSARSFLLHPPLAVSVRLWSFWMLLQDCPFLCTLLGRGEE